MNYIIVVWFSLCLAFLRLEINKYWYINWWSYSNLDKFQWLYFQILSLTIPSLLSFWDLNYTVTLFEVNHKILRLCSNICFFVCFVSTFFLVCFRLDNFCCPYLKLKISFFFTLFTMNLTGSFFYILYYLSLQFLFGSSNSFYNYSGILFTFYDSSLFFPLGLWTYW